MGWQIELMKLNADQFDDRMLDAVESPLAEANLGAGLADGVGFTAEQVRQITAMRRQRAMLQGAGERMRLAGDTEQALERLAGAIELVPQSLPISAFRVERQPAWQRVVASGWPMRVAAAACVAVVGYLGVVGYSAAQVRYTAWQQERAARLAAAGSGAAGGGSEVNPSQQQPSEVKVVVAQAEPATAVPAEVVLTTPAVVAAAGPATPSELARMGQLVILVRAKSAGQVNVSMSGLSKRVSDVLAVAPAEANWQSEVIASATTALAEMPGSTVMAGFAPQLNPGQPILVSYGPMAQSAVPTAERVFGSKFGVGVGTGFGAGAGLGSGAAAGTAVATPNVDARLRLADWFASRSATAHVLTVRDQPEAIERLVRRLGGSRGVTVELVRLDSPLPEVRLSAGPAGTAAAAKPGANTAAMDSLMWWTKPAAQWQRLELPVVVVEQ